MVDIPNDLEAGITIKAFQSSMRLVHWRALMKDRQASLHKLRSSKKSRREFQKLRVGQEPQNGIVR